MRKKLGKKLLSSSYILIRNKTYINFVLAEMMHFIPNIGKSQFGKAVLGYRMLFQTSETDPNGKGHAKTNLWQINSLCTHGTENQVVVCCDNYPPLIEVASEYFSIKIQ